MADRDEKEKALIKEIELLRQRVTELEHCEEERKRTEEIFLDLFNATEEAAFPSLWGAHGKAPRYINL
ncbi:MAG: hypothetical protein ABSH06_20745 [Thermodesulfobacteriota bacterium]